MNSSTRRVILLQSQGEFSGHVLPLRAPPVSTTTNNTISRSSAKSQYRGVANVVTQASWLHNLLRELHTQLFSAAIVYCDNVSAVYMSFNLGQHQRTKHIETDIHFVRDKIAPCHIQVLHVLSRYQYANILTKRLPSPLFYEFRFSLSVRISPIAQSAGRINVYSVCSLARLILR